MPQLRESVTFPLERNITWRGRFASEPAEAAWASEAIFFLRTLRAGNMPPDLVARAQISPDGMRWCDEGSTLALPREAEELTFCRLRHFGGWLRVQGELPPGAALRVILYLVLKG